MKSRSWVWPSLAALIAVPSWAHHNMSAMFDFNERFTKTGALAQVDWRNPHIHLVVEADGDAGALETWSFEGPPPAFFRSRDFTRADIEASLGKVIRIEASRARDGSKSGLMREVTLADGRVVSACPQNC